MAAVVFTVDAESATGTAPVPQRGGRRGARAANADVLIPFASVDPCRGRAGGAAGPRGWSRSTACGASSSTPASRPSSPTTAMAYAAVRGDPGDSARSPCSTPARPASAPGVPGGGGIRLKYSNPLHVDDVAADFPRPEDHPRAPVLPLAGRGARGRHPQARRVHRPVRLVAEVLPAAAGPVRQHAAAGQGPLRLGLPRAHPGPLARRLREAGDQGRGPAARSSRRTPPGCSGCDRP